VSCSTASLDLFGFLSIPMLSLLAFATVAALLVVLKRSVSR
jgi:disulfide bond formation protein DsbB